MLRILRLLSVSVVVLSLGAMVADAQNLRRDNGPAETPPASFKGLQYVDSRGCVYIRAGYSGNVTWVPRVTRSRDLVCGAKSTVTPRTKVASAAPKAQAPRVVQGKPPTNAQVVRRTVKMAPAPQAAKPVTRVVRRAVQVPQQQAQTQVVRQQAVKSPKVVYRCAGASDFSSQFVNKGARCGPQSASSRTVVREELSPQSRVAQGQLSGPTGVNRRISQASIVPPKGYKKAWDDGRLNPLRGVGTTSGKAQMAQVWSNTVPRYLIDPATGKRIN